MTFDAEREQMHRRDDFERAEQQRADDYERNYRPPLMTIRALNGAVVRYATEQIRTGEAETGTPYRVTREGARAALRSTFGPQLTDGGCDNVIAHALPDLIEWADHARDMADEAVRIADAWQQAVAMAEAVRDEGMQRRAS